MSQTAAIRTPGTRARDLSNVMQRPPVPRQATSMVSLAEYPRADSHAARVPAAATPAPPIVSRNSRRERGIGPSPCSGMR
jgi:hypothetical protein